MASSSSLRSNSQCPQWKYAVFLSFRGEDTRKTFTSHLYEGLRNRGIYTFQDDKRLEHGASISEELCKAIEESQVAVIIFSKNYASSTWCLDELVKIMECNKINQYGQTLVIPIFYVVEASTVRHQRESYAEAFDKHEARYKVKNDVEGMQKVQRWRTALTAAADLKGYDIHEGRSEAEHIKEIVDQISSKVQKTSSSYLKDVVGIDTHLENVKSLLDIQTNDVRIVGIWGMGGIGKTTLARAIFVTLSDKFEGACFLADVKENKCGMHSLQNTLLSELLGRKDDYVNNKEDGKHLMALRLRFKKVLVVLDDLDERDHLDYLAGDPSWFGEGSRIIVTTRDKHLIGKNDVVYEVTTLADREAIRLFNQYAFKEEVRDVYFEKLTLEAVSHAKGLPLALKVWGSFLYNRDITEWRSAIKLMKNSSNSKIIDKLKISYDGLETIQQKEIFLDIACFLRGRKKEEIKQILESCDFEADIGLRVLIDRSLVSISKKDTIEMHDLIQDMGKDIVNMQTDPVKRSRLWLVEDFKKVMTKNTGTEAIEAICCPYLQQLSFSKEAMRNMERLRILSIGVENCLMHDGSTVYLPNSLRWFAWDYYPWESLPEIFEPERLVHLELRFSSLRHFWTRIKRLPNLRELDLFGSRSLTQTPDFTEMPNLEYLDLRWCTDLEEVHHSLGNCKKLIRLYLNYCESLKRFPCVNVESLKYLCLYNCYSLEKFPEIHGRMKPELKIEMYRTHITKLDLSLLGNLVTLPSSIGKLKSLTKLDVSCCSKLEILPEEIGDLENLEKLDASYTLISRPPPSIVRLNKLKFLDFAKQKAGLKGGLYFVFPPVGEGLRSLEDLDLRNCNLIDGGLPEDIGCLSSLKELDLSGNNFDHLPQSIAQLSALQSLDLRLCESLTQLPELPPELYKLCADFHLTLKSIHNLLTLKKLQQVVLSPLCDKDEAYTDWIYNLFAHILFKNLSSLSERVFTIPKPLWEIPSWFHYQGMNIIDYQGMNIIDLPENWYICDSFLGFVICYSGHLIETTVQLIIPLCNDEMSWMTQKLAYYSEYDPEYHVFFVPFAGLWDESKANGRTPNDYGHIRVSFSGLMEEFGLRLLYKDEPTEQSIGIRSSGYDNSEHLDFTTNEASCSSSKKQRSHSNIRGRMASVFRNFAALSCKPKVLA